MLKLITFAAGLALGAGATTSWLLSEPGPTEPASQPLSADSLQARLDTLKVRLQQAVSEGEQAAAQTEDQLRRKFEAYRRGSAGTAIS
jgi:hypothetical protein